jgi:hypothetical protein
MGKNARIDECIRIARMIQGFAVPAAKPAARRLPKIISAFEAHMNVLLDEQKQQAVPKRRKRRVG